MAFRKTVDNLAQVLLALHADFGLAGHFVLGHGQARIDLGHPRERGRKFVFVLFMHRPHEPPERRRMRPGPIRQVERLVCRVIAARHDMTMTEASSYHLERTFFEPSHQK